jgi:hypothetical protein
MLLIVKLLMFESGSQNEIIPTSNAFVVRLQKTLLILISEISMFESLHDLPVIDFRNWMTPMISVSGVGLLMLLLETLEMLMNPKLTMDDNVMKEQEIELGDETFVMVMLLLDEIDPVMFMFVAIETSWM